ncbi:hypothetical protein [Thaumasiovibrio subtropicus]|uniref:hypothetical protein n=1 Tax=Thaumasiovibrio subtropicus TaxID=1891207 RepID=UPI000B34D72F|nr:hypothetical protein [Thaumasiovibrio subtropicus]
MKALRLIIPILLLVIIGYALPSFLSSPLLSGGTTIDDVNRAECYAKHGHCESSKGSIHLAHSQSILANQITVELPALKTNNLVLSLEGVEMDMGTYQVAIPRLSQTTYQTDLWFPACTHNEMNWVGTLEDKDGDFSMSVAIRVTQIEED